MPQGIRLVVGLGNPGSEYDKTRHNAGFWLCDELAKRYQGSFKSEKKFSGHACKVMIAGEPVWLLKPMTFMNKSGLSARQLSQFVKIPVEQILVAHDELDFSAGAAKIKQAGGHGGHNGLRDLHRHLSDQYWRIRIGIDHPGDKSLVMNYVLGTPSQSDAIAIAQAIDHACDEIESLVAGEFNTAMTRLNGA